MSLEKTEGIVLKNTPFSETSSVVKIYTPDFGLRSFMIKGVRKGKSNIKPAHVLPLNVLELDLYHKENAGLLKLKEIKCQWVNHQMAGSMIANGIGSLMLEFLNKVIPEEEPDVELFYFIKTLISRLEKGQEMEYIPLHLLVKMCRFLGIAPDMSTFNQGLGLNLESGQFDLYTADGRQMSPAFTQAFYTALIMDNYQGLNLSRGERRAFLDQVFVFYRYQMDAGFKLKSLDILQSIWEGNK